ncbi:MAG: hypothetical protein NVS2B15_27030 [Pseudarthrobacter sp.]
MNGSSSVWPAESMALLSLPRLVSMGAAVVGEYLRDHFLGRLYGDTDWAK